jgi:Outer membrane protein beta-barrel domain
LHFQHSAGLKAGLNFANVTKASERDNSSRSGFHVGVFLSPSTKSIISSRTEFIFSRQGYNYKNSSNTGNVNLDYIMLPQYMTINITKYFSIQLDGQMAYLLNAKMDSTANNTTGNGTPYGGIMNLYNRFDYGYGGGVEIHPVSGLLIGARINISLGNLYKEPQPGEQYSFFPSIDAKNNLFQIFAGWQFGKQSSSKKKKEEK